MSHSTTNHSSTELVSSRYLVDAFSNDVKQRRQDCIHNASKSMSRVSVLMMLLFVATWFHGWIR